MTRDAKSGHFGLLYLSFNCFRFWTLNYSSIYTRKTTRFRSFFVIVGFCLNSSEVCFLFSLAGYLLNSITFYALQRQVMGKFCLMVFDYNFRVLTIGWLPFVCTNDEHLLQIRRFSFRHFFELYTPELFIAFYIFLF